MRGGGRAGPVGLVRAQVRVQVRVRVAARACSVSLCVDTAEQVALSPPAGRVSPPPRDRCSGAPPCELRGRGEMALLLLLHLGHSSSTIVPSLTTVPSRLYSVAQSRWARCPAPLANEYDDWWNERRAQHTAVSTQAWAAARAREAAYNTGSAEGRAALRAARAKAASAQAAASAASAAPGALLQLDEDFYWSAGIMGDELSCWSPPPSSSVALVLHEFLRSDYAQVLFK